MGTTDQRERRITVGSTSYTLSAKEARDITFKRDTDKMLQEIYQSIRSQCMVGKTRLDVRDRNVLENVRSNHEVNAMPHTREIIGKLRDQGYQVELIFYPGGHGGPDSACLKIEW